MTFPSTVLGLNGQQELGCRSLGLVCGFSICSLLFLRGRTCTSVRMDRRLT